MEPVGLQNESSAPERRVALAARMLETQVAGTRANEFGDMVRTAGVRVAGLCRTPFPTAPEASTSLEQLRAKADTSAVPGTNDNVEVRNFWRIEFRNWRNTRERAFMAVTGTLDPDICRNPRGVDNTVRFVASLPNGRSENSWRRHRIPSCQVGRGLELVAWPVQQSVNRTIVLHPGSSYGRGEPFPAPRVVRRLSNPETRHSDQRTRRFRRRRVRRSWPALEPRNLLLALTPDLQLQSSTIKGSSMTRLRISS